MKEKLDSDFSRHNDGLHIDTQVQQLAAVVTRFQVTDQNRWKRLFDTSARERAAVGINGALVFVDADTPEYMIVIYQVDDIRRAKAYLTLQRNTDREFEVGVSEMQIWLGVEP